MIGFHGLKLSSRCCCQTEPQAISVVLAAGGMLPPSSTGSSPEVFGSKTAGYLVACLTLDIPHDFATGGTPGLWRCKIVNPTPNLAVPNEKVEIPIVLNTVSPTPPKSSQPKRSIRFCPGCRVCSWRPARSRRSPCCTAALVPWQKLHFGGSGLTGFTCRIL